MFDWDQEQKDLEREVKAPRNLNRAGGDGARRGSWWIVSSAILVAASVGVMAVLPAPSHWKGSVASLLSLPTGRSSYELAEIPSSLEVYDREVAIEVLVSLQRFSDEDLVTYVEATAASAFAPSGILVPYWNDALALAMSEMSRRGIAAPQGLAPVEPEAPSNAGEALLAETVVPHELNDSGTN